MLQPPLVLDVVNNGLVQEVDAGGGVGVGVVDGCDGVVVGVEPALDRGLEAVVVDGVDVDGSAACCAFGSVAASVLVSAASAVVMVDGPTGGSAGEDRNCVWITQAPTARVTTAKLPTR